jgi:hypothetical protein
MQNMQNITWFMATVVLLQHRNQEASYDQARPILEKSRRYFSAHSVNGRVEIEGTIQGNNRPRCRSWYRWRRDRLNFRNRRVIMKRGGIHFVFVR